MMASDNFPGRVTDLGFEWGALEVRRLCSDRKGGVVIEVRTEHSSLEIRATPKGRRMFFHFKDREKAPK